MEAVTQAVRAIDTDDDTGKGGGAYRLDDGSKAGLPVPDSIPADTLAGLMAKHQDLWVMSVSGYDLVLKVAAVTHGDRYVSATSAQNKAKEHTQIGPASRIFASQTVVWPPPASVAAMIDRYPGIAMTIAGEAVSIYMGAADELAKKVRNA